jgi:BCD family chlorophyll transporter-like MFS transporter
MGLWGAAQAVAFGLGGLVGTAASDLARWLLASEGTAYAAVFAGEGLLFVVSAWLAWRVSAPAVMPSATPRPAPVRPKPAALGHDLEIA